MALLSKNFHPVSFLSSFLHLWSDAPPTSPSLVLIFFTGIFPKIFLNIEFNLDLCFSGDFC